MNAEKTQVDAAVVREWANQNGRQVGARGHLPKDVVEAFNRAHRVKVYTNRNPWLRPVQED
jgi:hypothetical protein